MEALSLNDEEFKLISRLVYDKFGIKLGEQKRALIIGRLQKVLHTGGFLSFKDYYNHVVSEPSGKALLTLVDKISTNHTFFFRENEHFDFLSGNILPRILEGTPGKRKPAVRIWCAGCSSGEEPYSVAMVISEFFKNHVDDVDIGILATDISISALEKAVAGIYPLERMELVPIYYRNKYFEPLKDGKWGVKQNIKKMVLFRRLNLIRQNFPFKGLFQLIFCRNVMIYFDRDTQRDLINRFHRYTAPDGYLFIGHSETLDRSSGLYKYIRPSIYQKI
ncbi:MAG: Chemotaxis protein methyltransferase Cher2 [Firmicutes bacterium ADurb.Bin373]|nr:protein-glutamate O-methyltransferase [Bacillota bacterium]OQA09209.1 MAG: Chemotaxis protein methyltransferase Cher2 [Firmicutes bacterium ADurb.Bin373]